jgi:hypothetical protein
MLQSQSAVQSSDSFQSPGVIQSLERVRDRVEEQLIKFPEYRVFLAMETSIAEVASIPDLVNCLESAKGKILERLMTVREYQAMLAVEKSITEISEVLGVLADGESANSTPETRPVAGTEVNDQPELAVAPEARIRDPEAVSLIDAAADRLTHVLGLKDETFDKRIS